jgi:hypothetical protein
MLRIRLRLSIWLAKIRIHRVAKEHGVTPKFIWWIGAIDLDPKHLVFWIAADRDSERDELLADQTFRSDCIDAIIATGYPPDAARFTGIAIESQQTVDREFGGNWWYTIK